MTAPDVSTAQLYERLPGYVQAADEVQADRPLLSYLSVGGGALDVAAETIRRLTRRAEQPPAVEPSALTDPEQADLAWLPWLAQGVGVRLPKVTDEQALRDAVAFASSGWRRGIRAAIADSARSALTGSRYVRVYPHSITEPGNGGPWDILLVTRSSETPDVAAVLQAVVDKRAKPAGVVLHHRAYSATYAQVQGGTSPDTYAGRLDDFPTYQDASDYMPPGA